MALTVYGIPNCGTVRKARSWLESKGLPYQFVDFRAQPPAPAQVRAWVHHFGNKALRNTSGASYRGLGVEKDAWSDAEWAVAFQSDPMLIKRPVIEGDGVPLMVGFSASEADLLKVLAG